MSVSKSTMPPVVERAIAEWRGEVFAEGTGMMMSKIRLETNEQGRAGLAAFFNIFVQACLDFMQ